jgi:hypothetical protein
MFLCEMLGVAGAERCKRFGVPSLSKARFVAALCSFAALTIMSSLVCVPVGADGAPPGLAFSIDSLPAVKDQATSVTCTPNGPCVAIDYSGQFYLLNGPHVESIGAAGISTFGISCPTRTFCAVVGDDAALVISAAGSRTYPLQFGQGSNTHWQSLSCSSPTFCVAGGGVIGGPKDGAGVVASWNGSGWSRVHVVLPDLPGESKTQISSVSCTGLTFCIAADQDQRVLQWNGKKWLPARAFDDGVDSFTASCTSRSFCLAAGSSSSGTLTWNGRSWHNSDATDLSSTYGFVYVGCVSRSDCVGVSNAGSAQWWNGHAWSKATQLYSDRSDGIQGLACSSAGFCEAITSGDHFIYLYNPNQPPTLSVLCGTLACKPTTT